jgi:hypothetical protein
MSLKDVGYIRGKTRSLEEIGKKTTTIYNYFVVAKDICY